MAAQTSSDETRSRPGIGLVLRGHDNSYVVFPFPFDEAGKMVYQKAFKKGLAWIPAGHILRMSPPIVMPNDVAKKGMEIIEEAIGETEKELGG